MKVVLYWMVPVVLTGCKGDVTEAVLLRGIFRERPGLLRLDVRIGAIDQLHDQAHRPVIVAVLISIGDFIAGVDGSGEQTAVVRVLG